MENKKKVDKIQCCHANAAARLSSLPYCHTAAASIQQCASTDDATVNIKYKNEFKRMQYLMMHAKISYHTHRSKFQPSPLPYPTKLRHGTIHPPSSPPHPPTALPLLPYPTKIRAAVIHSLSSPLPLHQNIQILTA